MSLIDWLIVTVPTLFIVGLGIYSRRYIKGVTDFMSAGRVAGRYVICVGDVANALSILGLVSYVEIHYKTGFALVFWNNIMLPTSVVIGLFGYMTYRFRETKAMSLGQFLEMRYNRPFRIFASALRSASEMLINMIMPAIAARFFIYFLGLPHTIEIFGWTISTFALIVLICMTIALTLICMGGTLSLLVTDACQGMLLFPLMVVFVVFILCKFSWTDQMVPVMLDRIAKESFLNPYDISELRDFNIFMVMMTIVTSVMLRGIWIGAGSSTAAKSPHEQKMAALLGTWRNALNSLFYVLIAIGIIAVMNHTDFAGKGKQIRMELSRHIAEYLVRPEDRADFNRRIAAVPEQHHIIGKDAPLSQAKNLDTPTLDAAHEALKAYEVAHLKKTMPKVTADSELFRDAVARGNAKFQEYRTLYHQQMMAVGMRNLLPTGIMGMFCLLLVLAMISTDDTRIYSSSLTLTQDVVLPLCPNGLTPKQHIFAVRIVSIGVGLFFLIGSFCMSQLDYIMLYSSLMGMMWTGGSGPVMLFGLYSRFGNSAGAFSALISGMVVAFCSMFALRNWAGTVYPWLVKMGWAEGIGNFLETVSRPMNPVIIWKMNPVKAPINAFELKLMNIFLSLFIYILVSWLTQKEPFNLERMLHRGIYNTDGENKTRSKWTVRTAFSKLIGITPEYTLGDRCIAWGVFAYSIVYKFFLCFIGVMIWNHFSPWKPEWWGKYFFVTTLLVPGIVAFFSTFWFGIGGAIDLFRLFRDLEKRVADPLDNGWVEGHVSLSDKAKFEELERNSRENGTGKGEK
ncbi:MAG: sodium:panthothenate symporter [Lentisphaeria bacterium]|nr:sodium:panthothenate symporter [Lentisphaeria bacterium]